MKMKQLSENGLRWYTTGPSHLKNTMFSRTKKNSFAVWKHLRNANRAREDECKRKSFYKRSDLGDNWCYNINGWGIASDCTIVVSVNDESLD